MNAIHVRFKEALIRLLQSDADYHRAVCDKNLKLAESLSRQRHEKIEEVYRIFYEACDAE